MRRVIREGRQRWLAAFLMGLIVALVMGTKAVGAEAPPQEVKQNPLGRLGQVGFDISWPQCGAAYPAEHQVGYGIVGVTGGRAFTRNDCLAHQWEWAKKGGTTPEVYINVNGWRGQPGIEHFWGKAGICGPTNELCQAYNYGWNTARDAIGYGMFSGIDAKHWWLDVETMNYWGPNKQLNAKIIEGAIDAIEDAGLETGVYSTPYQWGVIAGDYAPGKPVWTAGASNLNDAMRRCVDPRYAFGGGEVELVQWVETYDMNYACKP